MHPLSILILSDGRPGHYHLAEGVAAAIGRRRPIVTRRIELTRNRAAPNRVLAVLAGVAPALALKTGYGLAAAALGKADLIISAGGDTLAANVAAARLIDGRNIFCGTLRHFKPEAFSLVISSYARHRNIARHLVALKPSGIDPDGFRRGTRGGGRALRAGLLVGGDSGLFHYTAEEWQRLVDFVSESHAKLGLEWIVSTSRRSPDHVADALVALAARPNSPVLRCIDFRSAGPGTLPDLFANVDAILATEDSSTMISEAVCARLPVVGVSPVAHNFKDEEREYRTFMRDEGWCRFLALELLSPQTFMAALGEVAPLRENHIDRLAHELQSRLPALFEPVATGQRDHR